MKHPLAKEYSLSVRERHLLPQQLRPSRCRSIQNWLAQRSRTMAITGATIAFSRKDHMAGLDVGTTGCGIVRPVVGPSANSAGRADRLSASRDTMFSMGASKLTIAVATRAAAI